MTVYCNEDVSQDTLQIADWVVSESLEAIVIGIESGCNTIFLGKETSVIQPTLFAPSKEEALRFIQANERVH